VGILAQRLTGKRLRVTGMTPYSYGLTTYSNC